MKIQAESCFVANPGQRSQWSECSSREKADFHLACWTSHHAVVPVTTTSGNRLQPQGTKPLDSWQLRTRINGSHCCLCCFYRWYQPGLFCAFLAMTLFQHPPNCIWLRFSTTVSSDGSRSCPDALDKTTFLKIAPVCAKSHCLFNVYLSNRAQDLMNFHWVQKSLLQVFWTHWFNLGPWSVNCARPAIKRCMSIAMCTTVRPKMMQSFWNPGCIQWRCLLHFLQFAKLDANEHLFKIQFLSFQIMRS